MFLSLPHFRTSPKVLASAFMFVLSFIHILLIGMVDALIKGSIIAHYHNWAKVPWYFKDENLFYPSFIAVLLFALGILLAKWCSFGWRYPLLLFVWAAGGLESLSYWFWIAVLPIGQKMWWLPDSSFFWWYPRSAPWLNKLIHLQWISQAENVSRTGVLIGVLTALAINVTLAFFWKNAKRPQEKKAARETIAGK